jgi:hypothetical protein
MLTRVATQEQRYFADLEGLVAFLQVQAPGQRMAKPGAQGKEEETIEMTGPEGISGNIQCTRAAAWAPTTVCLPPYDEPSKPYESALPGAEGGRQPSG